MTQKVFIEKVSEKAEMTKKDTEKFIKAFEEVVTEALVNDDEVKLTGFLSLSTTIRASREGVNPSTGEKIIIPETKAVKVKVGKSLKDTVKASK